VQAAILQEARAPAAGPQGTGEGLLLDAVAGGFTGGVAPQGGRSGGAALDPAPAPVPPVVDQRLDLAEEEKLRGDNALVLRRLRCGPATTAELAAAAPRSMAIHSRVADVRTYLERHGETVVRRRIGPRLHVYRIEGA